MFIWPELELTDYERRFVRVYGDDEYDGVLKRVYRMGTFSNFALPDLGQLTPVFADQLQVSRRSRVAGLVFGGDIDSFFCNIRTAGGTLYTAVNRQALTNGLAPQPGCQVASMVSGTWFNSESWLGIPIPEQASTALGSPYQSGVMQVEPNWVLTPNTTLIFETQVGRNIDRLNPDDFPDTDQFKRRVLSIGVHVWEFPGMAPGRDIPTSKDALERNLAKREAERAERRRWRPGQ